MTSIFVKDELVKVFENNKIKNVTIKEVVSLGSNVYKYLLYEKNGFYLEENLFRNNEMIFFKLNGFKCLNNFNFNLIADDFSIMNLSAMNCRGLDFTNVANGSYEFEFIDMVLDGTDLTNAIPPSNIISKTVLKNKIRSWHPIHTKYFDGSQLGY